MAFFFFFEISQYWPFTFPLLPLGIRFSWERKSSGIERKGREIETGKGIQGTAMAPHGEGSDGAVEAMAAQVENHPISSILIIIG